MTTSELMFHVLETSGFELDVIGESTLQNLLDARKRFLGLRDDLAYLQILKQDPGEWQLLLEDLLVPETWFFRDQDTFDFILKTARRLICARPGTALRILSAPCASGEEPYSVAMALLEKGFPETSFVIEAIDISPKQIEKARAGQYLEALPRGCCSDKVAKYFTRNGKKLLLSDNIRKLVHFSQENLIGEFKALTRLPYDIVLCKNLLIYLSDKARNTLIKNVRQLLVEDGVLFAGHAEISFLCNNGFRVCGPAGAFACQWAGDNVAEKSGILSRTPSKGRTRMRNSLVSKARTEGLPRNPAANVSGPPLGKSNPISKYLQNSTKKII